MTRSLAGVATCGVPPPRSPSLSFSSQTLSGPVRVADGLIDSPSDGRMDGRTDGLMVWSSGRERTDACVGGSYLVLGSGQPRDKQCYPHKPEPMS